LRLFDKALADFSSAIMVNPQYENAYKARATVYFMKRNYDAAWSDVKALERLGGSVDSRFLKELQKASGKK